jgi:hypothetical protein
MDGLSGMKVYQRYEIDITYLPANYPKSLEFLIKGITNTIQDNEWITTIESIAIPKNPFGSVIGEGAVGSASGGSASGTRDINRGSSSRIGTTWNNLNQNKKAKDLLSPRSSLIGNIEANPLESNDLQIQPN